MNYVYDVNQIMMKANEQGLFTLESLCLQLDNLLIEGTLSPQAEKMMDSVIEFMYGLVE